MLIEEKAVHSNRGFAVDRKFEVFSKIRFFTQLLFKDKRQCTVVFFHSSILLNVG